MRARAKKRDSAYIAIQRAVAERCVFLQLTHRVSQTIAGPNDAVAAEVPIPLNSSRGSLSITIVDVTDENRLQEHKHVFKQGESLKYQTIGSLA